MMKLVGLSLLAVSVAAAQSAVEVVNAGVQVAEHDELSFDLDSLPTEELSKFGSFKAHLHIDVKAALQAVEHEEIMAKSAFRSLQKDDAPEPSEKCKKCADGTMKWIVNFTTKKFEQVCASAPKCPFQQKMCEVYKKHPKVIQGFLFGEFNTPLTAFAFCIGKKECEVPKDLWDDNGKEFNMPIALSALDDFTGTADYNDNNSRDTEPLPMARPPPPPQDCDCSDPHGVGVFDDDKSVGTTNPKPPCDCICTSCIHHMTKFVLSMTIEHLKDYCQNAKDEKAKKMCDWAEKHKEEVVGFLFFKVQPWKGAMGFCAGNGRCLPGHGPNLDHSKISPSSGNADHAVIN